MTGLDTWHGILMGACGSLTSALGILWRTMLKKDAQHAAAIASKDAQLEAQHADHVADVKELTRETLELARAATSAPPLRLSASRPQDSNR